MTIDERLEKLTERHEALAQSLEINVGLQRDHDQRMRQAIETLTALHVDNERLHGESARLHGESARMHADNEQRMANMMDAIGRLSHIAANHEDRISGLEGQP